MRCLLQQIYFITVTSFYYSQRSFLRITEYQLTFEKNTKVTSFSVSFFIWRESQELGKEILMVFENYQRFFCPFLLMGSAASLKTLCILLSSRCNFPLLSVPRTLIHHPSGTTMFFGLLVISLQYLTGRPGSATCLHKTDCNK